MTQIIQAKEQQAYHPSAQAELCSDCQDRRKGHAIAGTAEHSSNSLWF
nr:hypothetical protein [uncultured Pseudomonas sp.]